MWFFDESVNYAHTVSTSSYWVGAIVKKNDGSSHPVEQHEYNLRVIISSSPAPREDTFQENYVLTTSGFKNLTPPLVPHALDSQARV